MSKWGKLITTKQGKTALSQAITDNKLVFTSVKTSDLSHSEEVEQLNSIIQTVNTENVSNVDGTISVNVRIDNSNLEVGYHIKTIGLYARLENESEEFLYAYCVSNKPDYMPEHSNDTVSSIRYSFALKITDSEKVNITIDDVIISESDVIEVVNKVNDFYKFDSLSNDGKTLNFKPNFEGSVNLVEVITSRTVNSIMCNVRYLDNLGKVLRYDLIEISKDNNNYKITKNETIINKGNIIKVLDLNNLIYNVIETLKLNITISELDTEIKNTSKSLEELAKDVQTTGGYGGDMEVSDIFDMNELTEAGLHSISPLSKNLPCVLSKSTYHPIVRVYRGGTATDDEITQILLVNRVFHDYNEQLLGRQFIRTYNVNLKRWTPWKEILNDKDTKIGGRNYLTQEEQNRIAKYSDVITTDSALVDGLYQHKIVALTDVTIRAAIPEYDYGRFFSEDDELIVSCDIKTTEELSVKLDYSTTQEYTKVPANKWVRISSKVKYDDRIGIYSEDRASEGTVIFLKNYKLEKGTIATDWTPTLEDSGVNVNEAVDKHNTDDMAHENIRKDIEDIKYKGCLVIMASQSIPSDIQTIVNWSNVRYDDLNIYNSDKPTRLTVPKGVEKVRVIAYGKWANNDEGNRQMTVLLNGKTEYGKTVSDTRRASGYTDSYISTPVISVKEGDYFELAVMQDTGSSLNFSFLVNTNYYPFFGMEVIR